MRYSIAFLVSYLFLSAVALAQSSTSDGHLLADRWSMTATDGGSFSPFSPNFINRGDSITLTWGFVQDGTPIPANTLAADPTSVESADPSSLVSFFDSHFGVTSTSDLTQSSWFPIFEETFDRYAAVSGLNFTYEPNDNGGSLGGAFNPGVLGVVADVRIGGHSIDGGSGSNILAYNFFPDTGDMVIDTDNVSLFGSDNLSFRNVIAHEFGHGIGIEHLTSSDEVFLLEPFLNTSITGPQHSDILGLHRGYGDYLEGGLGNDTAANATGLGNIDVFAGIGLDGALTDVALTDDDFISIDGSSDTDFFSFNVTQAGDATIDLTPLGYSYNIAEEDGSNSVTVNTNSLNDLEFVLFDQDGNTVLGSGNSNGIGLAESLVNVPLAAGTYFIEVSGNDDRAQFYSITSSFVPTAVPEPSSLVLTLLAGVAMTLRRKRFAFAPLRS